MEQTPDWQVPGYEDVEELGRGGFGRVVLARRLVDGMPVAVKYLAARLVADPAFRVDFQQEARMLAGLQSAHTVRLYEYVETGGEPATGAPQQPAGTNRMAVAALVLGICGFLFFPAIIGLVLGLASLSAVRRSGQRGKGLAVSGIVLSSVWIAVFATLVTINVVSTPNTAERDANGNVVRKGNVSVFDLRPKDCFILPTGLVGSTSSTAQTLTLVPCSTPHDSEVLGSFDLAESSFPGVDAIRAESTSGCAKVLSTYLPDVAALPTGSRFGFDFPEDKVAWAVSQHKVTCFLQLPTATMTHSVYRDASSYTADQLRFLDAVRPVFETDNRLNAMPEATSLMAGQQRADALAAAIQSEVTALTAAPWPADVQPAVDALVAEHQVAARLWSRAAGATDAISFGILDRLATDAYTTADLNAARTALALPPLPVGS